MLTFGEFAWGYIGILCTVIATFYKTEINSK